MQTEVFKLGQGRDEEVLVQAAKIIQEGGLVAFPTETVYGLGASAFDQEAVLKVYEAKQRPSWDPLITHVESYEKLLELLKEKPLILEKLKRHMPGPLTIVVDQQKVDERLVTASASKISLRVPNHSVAQKFIQLAGVPIAAPSANLFGRPSPTTAEHVLEDLDGKIDAVLDAGPTTVGVESTVLDLTTTPPTILRPGGVTKETLEKLLGAVEIKKGTAVEKTELPSPGMATLHYSPKARVVLTEGDESSLNLELEKYSGSKTGAMLPRGWHIYTPHQTEVFDWGDWGNKNELALRLYLGFRDLDRRNVDVIVCPRPDDKDLGLAIGDRLHRAASK